MRLRSLSRQIILPNVEVTTFLFPSLLYPMLLQMLERSDASFFLCQHRRRLAPIIPEADRSSSIHQNLCHLIVTVSSGPTQWGTFQRRSTIRQCASRKQHSDCPLFVAPGCLHQRSLAVRVSDIGLHSTSQQGFQYAVNSTAGRIVKLGNVEWNSFQLTEFCKHLLKLLIPLTCGNLKHVSRDFHILTYP